MNVHPFQVLVRREKLPMYVDCRDLNRKQSVQDKTKDESHKLFGKMKFSKLIIFVGLFYQLFSVQSKRVNKFKAKQLKGNLISILWMPN
jgi:hypothetical protein